METGNLGRAAGHARAVVVALVALTGLLGLHTPPASAGPMDLGGQFSVNETGAATYTVPIQVPPGTAGIEPKLALSYNSQTGNGLLGVGWSLSGLSAITRCPRTIAQDGVRGGVNFDANDRYCLDGQRLMAISGTYGAAGTEYRTERDSFSKIIGYSGSTGDIGYFKVWTKAGQILEYGNTVDSRIEAQGKTQARVWALNKISDTQGNTLTFSYVEDSPNGDYYPQRIDYTSNPSTGLVANNAVQFQYETRPDITPMYFQGSLIKSTQRLTKVQTYSGTTQSKEYRLTYGVGATTNRSRITSLTECVLPSNICKPALTPTWTEYGSNSFNAGSSWGSLVTSFLADVNGDGKADFIAQQADGLYASLSTGSSVGAQTKWAGFFGTTQGFSSLTNNPISIIDINGDGLADAVGFGYDGVYVALSTGNGFGGGARWTSDFGNSSNVSVDAFVRTLADVNGDGLLDVVGFKSDGVYVALNAGSGFGASQKWSSEFGTASAIAYPTYSVNPRMMQDINGDGLPDVVGFANGGVYVGLNTGSGFSPAVLWLADFGVNAGYTNMDSAPRAMADVNGDGLPDLVGFKSDGTYVALNTGTGFQATSKWLVDFGASTPIAYSTQSGYPRQLADVNGDGKADIVGFSAGGVYVALSTGTGYSTSSQWVAGFGASAGYTASNLRQLADMDGDGFPDIVGALSSGTSVAKTNRTGTADVIGSIAQGTGLMTTVTYGPLTNSSLYTKGTGAVYPQVELMPPLYVVTSAKLPNALSANYTTYNYQYGGLRSDLSGRGLLGFNAVKVSQPDTGLISWTRYRQDWPYIGLPMQAEQSLPGAGSNGLLKRTTNTYGCLLPQSGGSCSVAPGNSYFPYLSQSVETGWDTNGAALPQATTTNTFDTYGNATQVAIVTGDGFSKNTTNVYSNDTTKWLLGRLIQAQVMSSNGGSGGGSAGTVFVFSQTLTANTFNYNIRNAAASAGWDQSTPLQASITVAPGVIIGSRSTLIPAFDTDANFPAGSSLTLVNNGSILGAGGQGGSGGAWNPPANSTWTGNAGQAGGLALRSSTPISITNGSGTIGGGGGGGGAGAMMMCCWGTSTTGGGGGGGGGSGPMSQGGGAPGISKTFLPLLGTQGQDGNPGSVNAGGMGGAGGTGSVYGSTMYAGAGGSGGSLGNAGNAGQAAPSNPSYFFGGSGGSPGAAVVGNANITWTATGTRLGPIQ